MQGFQFPTAADELTREPVEQRGIRGRDAGLAEVVRRRHEAAAEMMLPHAIHRHAGHQCARAVLDIGKPVRERTAAAGIFRAGWRRPLPARFVRVAHEHLEEALRREGLLLIRVAALENVGFFEEWGPCECITMGV